MPKKEKVGNENEKKTKESRKVVNKKSKIEKNKRSLGEYMTELLKMPAEDAKKEELLANGYRGKELNHALLLAQSVLDKAIEKGDVAAFKEVKALLEEESGEQRIPLEEMVKSLCKMQNNENNAVCGGNDNENGYNHLDYNLSCDRNINVLGDKPDLVDETFLEPE